jgi:ADP-heptose:LPS heptosyltransferase
VLPIKRKFESALWRLKQAAFGGYQRALKLFVETLTERYWLLDYLPTFSKHKEGVLLIRLDLIGDFVLWLDAALAYRQLYPNKRITLAVDSACAELAKSLPHWDEVLSIDVQRLRKDFGYRLRVVIMLHRRNFAIAIQPTFSREFVGDLLLRATCATERIGYVGDTNNIPDAKKTKTDFWYHRLIVNHSENQMELNTNAHFVRELGCIDFLSRVPVIANVATLSAHHQISVPYIVIAPGASWQPKMWPVRHFAELIRQLNSQFSIHFVLCGGKGDYALCTELEQDVDLNNLTNLAGRTSLLELVSVIQAAALVVSNDSSPVHIAAATATPAVCILGGGHFGRFLPYRPEQGPLTDVPTALWASMECFGCRWRCTKAPEVGTTVPCISRVAIDEVLQSCLTHLNVSAQATSALRCTNTKCD